MGIESWQRLPKILGRRMGGMSGGLCFNPAPSYRGHLWDLTRWLRTLPARSWKAPERTRSSAWPSSLSCIFALNLSLFYTHDLRSSHQAPLLRTWLHLLDDLLVGMDRMLLHPPEAVSSPGQRSPAPPAPCEGQLLQFLLPPPPHLLWAITEFMPVYQCFSVLGVPILDAVL